MVWLISLYLYISLYCFWNCAFECNIEYSRTRHLIHVGLFSSIMFKIQFYWPDAIICFWKLCREYLIGGPSKNINEQDYWWCHAEEHFDNSRENNTKYPGQPSTSAAAPWWRPGRAGGCDWLAAAETGLGCRAAQERRTAAAGRRSGWRTETAMAGTRLSNGLIPSYPLKLNL